jgi:hypothetical protein
MVINNNDYNIKTIKILGDLPHVNVIEYRTDAIGSIQIQVTRWPTGNCQLSTVAYSQGIRLIKDQNIQVFMKHLAKVSNTTVLFDLREEYYKPVMKKINRYVSKVNIKRYINTNGSNMIMCIIKLNREVIFNNPF